MLLLTVWTASLFGSAHCVGMCGPLAVLAGTHGHSVGLRTSWVQVLGYHLGRLVPYVVLGCLFGWLGQLVDFGAGFWGLTRVTAWLAGGAMVAAGGVALARQFGIRIPFLNASQPLARWIQRGFRAVTNLSPLAKSLAIGGLTALLPCGWLYVFLMTAAGVADPFWGGAVMLVFWSGTVPLLLGVMLGADKLLRQLPVPLPLLTAILAIVVGGITMTGRAQAQLSRSMEKLRRGDDVQQQLEVAVQETPDCCRHKQSETTKTQSSAVAVPNDERSAAGHSQTAGPQANDDRSAAGTREP